MNPFHFASIRRSLAVLAIALASAALAPAQTVVAFHDDFEAGLGYWSTTQEWSLDSEQGTCGVYAAPFPSSSHAAHYGSVLGGSTCGFGDYIWTEGFLTTVLPIDLPGWASAARLRFSSFEQTECGYGNCGWDERYIYVSIDGGQSWVQVGVGAAEGAWFARTIDLSAYLGHAVLVRFGFAPVDSWANYYLGWLIDDVTVEYDAPPAGTYCTGKVSSAGCIPTVSWSGDTSLGGPDDLVVRADLLLNNVASKLIWSRAPNSTPFHGGTLCVQAPAARTTVLLSGGSAGTATDCSGAYSFAFTHAYLASKNVLAGQTLYVQASTRDPGFPPPDNHSLSAGLYFTILP
jgi:hypothetical protein